MALLHNRVTPFQVQIQIFSRGHSSFGFQITKFFVIKNDFFARNGEFS